MPVYGCKIPGVKQRRLVRARSAAQARAYLVDAEPLSADELAEELGKEGAKLETATVPAYAPAEMDGEEEAE
jgi:hypothetical protein